MIPTTTSRRGGGGKVPAVVSRKLDSSRMRVPTPRTVVRRPGGGDEPGPSHRGRCDTPRCQNSADGPLKGVCRLLPYEELGVDRLPGNAHSSIVDMPYTKVMEAISQVLSWYDNEWGYSNASSTCFRKLVRKPLARWPSCFRRMTVRSATFRAACDTRSADLQVLP